MVLLSGICLVVLYLRRFSCDALSGYNFHYKNVFGVDLEVYAMIP